MIGYGMLLAAVAWPGAASADARVAACTAPVANILPKALAAEIARHNQGMAAARVSGDVDGLMAHFAPDSVIMPEHQPRLFGRDRGVAYYRAFTARLPIATYDPVTVDILPLANGALEWGTFKVRYRNSVPSPVLDGKYVHLWRRQAEGTLKLKAEVWGYVSPLADPASHWIAEVSSGTPAQQHPDAGVAAELAALNAADARSVQSHDTSRIDQYAQDAVYLPFAEKPQLGLPAIRAHLTPYIERGRGATFDGVNVGNDGFEVLDGYVIEYSKFEVRWRAGEAAGVTSGGGLRLWRREADCSLKKIRQIGTHDYRP
ncbi:hypothetical protein BXU08_13200 [Sphingomonas sp. LM7]|nr:hypothetical protein BXU08_13200 [Sphingomonas sp. LM7]